MESIVSIFNPLSLSTLVLKAGGEKMEWSVFAPLHWSAEHYDFLSVVSLLITRKGALQTGH